MRKEKKNLTDKARYLINTANQATVRVKRKKVSTQTTVRR